MAAGVEPWLIEIVAGMIDEGETTQEVAVRETREETGAGIKELIPVGRYLLTPGGSSESIMIYCGRVDSSKLDGFHGLAEEGEDIRVFSLPVRDAFEQIASGQIANATAVIALQWLALHHDQLKAQWA